MTIQSPYSRPGYVRSRHYDPTYRPSKTKVRPRRDPLFVRATDSEHVYFRPTRMKMNLRKAILAEAEQMGAEYLRVSAVWRLPKEKFQQLQEVAARLEKEQS